MRLCAIIIRMKKELKNKLIVSGVAVFGIAVLFASVGIIYAQTWTPPKSGFPNAAGIYAPLDTGPGGQVKAGNLSVSSLGITYGNSIFSSESGGGINVFYPLTTVGANQYQTQISNPSGALYVNTKGMVLPNYDSSMVNSTAGMITFSPSEKKVKLFDGSGWADVGTGIVEDTSGWFYGARNGDVAINGNVAINGDLAFGSVSGYLGRWSKGLSVIKTEVWRNNSQVKNIENEQKNNRMSCDKNVLTADCTDGYYPSVDGYVGQVRYDIWYECTNPSNPYAYSLDGTSVFCAYSNTSYTGDKTGLVLNARKFYYETIPAVGKTTIYAGNIEASGDIKMTSGKLLCYSGNSPFVTGSVQGPVGWPQRSVSARGQDGKDNDVGFLPEGYNGSRCVVFLQGFDLEDLSNDPPWIGSHASCWVKPGDNIIHGAYAGDGGPTDGTVKCGYLCW